MFIFLDSDYSEILKHWGPDIFKKPEDDLRCVALIGDEQSSFVLDPRVVCRPRGSAGSEKENLVPRGLPHPLSSTPVK